MGKRGPQPKGGYSEKSGTLSTRITGALRDQLKRSAAKSGRSLSSEIEHRLRASFDYEARIEGIFGNRIIYGMLRAAGSAMATTAEQAARVVKGARREAKDDSHWLDDPYVFDQATKAARVILELFRPAGSPARPPLPVPEGMPKAAAQAREAQIYGLGEGITWGPGAALHLLRAIRDAPNELPLPGDDKLEMEAKRIRVALGPVVKRLKKGDSK